MILQKTHSVFWLLCYDQCPLNLFIPFVTPLINLERSTFIWNWSESKFHDDQQQCSKRSELCLHSILFLFWSSVKCVLWKYTYIFSKPIENRKCGNNLYRTELNRARLKRKPINNKVVWRSTAKTWYVPHCINSHTHTKNISYDKRFRNSEP